MFKQGTNYFREKGIESQLYLKWIGEEYKVDVCRLDSTVLTSGQVVLAFTFVASLYGLSLIVLGGEVMTKNFINQTKVLTNSQARRASI